MFSHSIRDSQHVVVIRSALNRQLSSGKERPSKPARAPQKAAQLKSSTPAVQPVRISPMKTSNNRKYVAYVPPVVVPQILQSPPVAPSAQNVFGWSTLATAFWQNGIKGVSNAFKKEQKRVILGQKRLLDQEIAKLYTPKEVAENLAAAKTHFSKGRWEVSERNPLVLRARGVMENLAPHISEDHLVKWSLHVYETRFGDNASATRMLNGLILVQFHTGAIERCGNDDMLAWLAGHELSHIIINHAEETRWIPFEAAEPIRLRQEFEADHLGQMLAASAGYDPRGGIQFLEMVKKKRAQDAKRMPPKPKLPGHETHPPDDERIERLKASLDEAYQERDSYAAERKRLVTLKRADVEQTKTARIDKNIVTGAAAVSKHPPPLTNSMPPAQSAFGAGRTAEEPIWKGITYSSSSEKPRLNNREESTK